MIETKGSLGAGISNRLGVLGRDFQARLVNCSPTGCLLETNSRIEVGTVGTLHFVVDGSELSDDIQVVRCQAIEGAGSLFQVGARFLWTTSSRTASGSASLRAALGSSPVDRTARLAG
jgi:hypothetical protein